MITKIEVNVRDKQQISKFSESVLEWTKVGLRDFPWRRTNDPYNILIAEIMLQRTKANQVKPVFEHFIQKYREEAE